jgi:hypothetical protein
VKACRVPAVVKLLIRDKSHSPAFAVPVLQSAQITMLPNELLIDVANVTRLHREIPSRWVGVDAHLLQRIHKLMRFLRMETDGS